MWLPTLITITVLFLVFGYWYKYKCTDQIDKIIMNPTKQLLCLLLCVFLIFAFLILIGSYALDDKEDISAIVMLYGLFSQTKSAYDPDISTDLQLYSLFVSVLGAVFFSGILVSTITNSVLRRVEDYKTGKIHYSSLNKHDIIIGANEAIVAIVNSLKGNKNKIIIVSDKSACDVKKMLYRVEKKTVDKQIIIYNEHSLNPMTLKWLRVEKCNSITILGENTFSLNDSANIMVLDSLIKYMNRLKSKKPNPIKCYISYLDSYYIMNYCRDEETSSVNIIPFNFYASWANTMWGVGRLNAMFPTTKNEKKEEGNNYKSLMNGVGPDKQKHFLILGYSKFAEEIIKFILLNGHSPYYDEKGNGKTLITLISPVKGCLDTLNYKYQLKDIADMELNHLCYSELSVQSKNYIERCANDPKQVVSILCCSRNTNNNIVMTSGLPKCVHKKELQVWAVSDYSMPWNSPIDNKGNQLGYISFFGNLEQNIYGTVDAELKYAQAFRYIHRAEENKNYKDCKIKAYNQWFGEGGISKQIDKPKMNILSRVCFLPTLFELMGVEVCCSEEDGETFEKIFPMDKFLPLFHLQQCAHNVLFGYTAVKKGQEDFKTKEIYHLLPYSEIKDCEEIVGPYKRFYKDINTWLKLNKLGLKSC